MEVTQGWPREPPGGSWGWAREQTKERKKYGQFPAPEHPLLWALRPHPISPPHPRLSSLLLTTGHQVPCLQLPPPNTHTNPCPPRRASCKLRLFLHVARRHSHRQPCWPDAGEKRVFVQEIQQGPPREGHPQRGDLADAIPWMASQELPVLGWLRT